MTDIELKVINAHALEPGKIYVLEVDRTKVSTTQMQGVLNYLERHGIAGASLRTIGGDGLRIVEVEKES